MTHRSAGRLSGDKSPVPAFAEHHSLAFEHPDSPRHGPRADAEFISQDRCSGNPSYVSSVRDASPDDVADARRGTGVLHMPFLGNTNECGTGPRPLGVVALTPGAESDGSATKDAGRVLRGYSTSSRVRRRLGLVLPDQPDGRGGGCPSLAGACGWVSGLAACPISPARVRQPSISRNRLTPMPRMAASCSLWYRSTASPMEGCGPEALDEHCLCSGK